MNQDQELIKNKQLIWYTNQYDKLDDEAIVEAVLNYGDWDDVQSLIKTLGMRHVADIFRAHAFRQRTNYLPEVSNYFNLFFEKYA